MGENRDPDHTNLPTSVTRTPICSVRSTRRVEPARLSRRLGSILKPCRRMSIKLPGRSKAARTPFSSSIARHGTPRANSSCTPKHQTNPAAIAGARTQSCGARLAVHEGQLAFEPSFRELRRHHRSHMRGVEQPHETPRDYKVNRNEEVGPYRSNRIAAGMIFYFDYGQIIIY